MGEQWKHFNFLWYLITNMSEVDEIIPDWRRWTVSQTESFFMHHPDISAGGISVHDSITYVNGTCLFAIIATAYAMILLHLWTGLANLTRKTRLGGVSFFTQLRYYSSHTLTE